LIIKNGKKETMNKRLKGFSLAELLISLLVISIVLSAAIPTLTKRSGADREHIWRWTSQGNSAYFGVGSNQSTLIGIDTHPAANSQLDALLTDPEEPDSGSSVDNDNRPEAGVINVGDLKFNSYGDKLVILKKTVQGNNSNFMNSHISFFTLSNNEAATTSDIQYAGRLTMDPGNIALGMGSLQSISEENVGENTAIGHYALLRNTDGYRNTAVGKKTLSYNTEGAYNTALGYASLFELEGNKVENTAIGALSQLHADGSFNTSVGSQSLSRNQSGDRNTAIGTAALRRLEEGDSNTALGAEACKYIKNGEGNICLGYWAGNLVGATEDNYGLYIGSGFEEIPIISGHTQKTDNNDKELIVNAKNVQFRPAKGIKPSFSFISWAGNDGYEGTDKGQHGIAQFMLRDTGGAGDNTSAELDFRGGIDNNKVYTFIDSYDPYNTASINSVDIKFNRMLTLDFPPVTIAGKNITNKVNLKTEKSGVDTLILNDKLEVKYHNDTPKLVMDNQGFNLTSKDGTQQINAASWGLTLGNDDNKINIAPDEKKISILTDSFGVSTKTINIESTDGNINFGNQTVYIDSKDITIHGISKNRGSLTENINKIWTQIEQLQRGIPSDARLKNISGDNTAGLKEINALEVKNYTYKNDEKKTPHVGVIAQQLQKIFPNSVTKGDDGYLRIRTEEIFYAMVNSIKELCKQIQDLTAKVTGLDKRITELEAQNKLLTEQNKAFEKRLEKLEKKSAK